MNQEFLNQVHKIVKIYESKNIVKIVYFQNNAITTVVLVLLKQEKVLCIKITKCLILNKTISFFTTPPLWGGWVGLAYTSTSHSASKHVITAIFIFLLR
jgi:hypothetical protein